MYRTFTRRLDKLRQVIRSQQPRPRATLDPAAGEAYKEIQAILWEEHGFDLQACIQSLGPIKDRRHFFYALGKAMSPYPGPKQAVVEFLQRQVEKCRHHDGLSDGDSG